MIEKLCLCCVSFFAIFAERLQHMSPSTISAFLPLEKWLPPVNDGLLVVAGPCSVESCEQLGATARAIAAGKRTQVLRAGVWKPRSKPGQFEGKGEEALPWVREAGREFGLHTAVEVANPKHVELCLKYQIDILWLGARTSVNPFMVQEIAESIRGTEIGVMVKNPVCPDLRLWSGAIERIERAGINKIIAVHRGFYIHQKSKYRNVPLWNIPLQLAKETPGLPLICDPSHIAGHRELIAEVAAHALALNMRGLMLEVHHNPDIALTDPLQQITPHALSRLLNQLINDKPSQDCLQKIIAIRKLIDEKDYELLELLAERMTRAREIGKLKKMSKTGVVQTERLKDIIADRLNKAEDLGLSTSFIHELMQLIHQESVAIQSNNEQTAKAN